MDAGIVDKTYTVAKFNESAQILQAHNDNDDQRSLQEIFGFPVTGKQGSQARYCRFWCAGVTIDDRQVTATYWSVIILLLYRFSLFFY